MCRYTLRALSRVGPAAQQIKRWGRKQEKLSLSLSLSSRDGRKREREKWLTLPSNATRTYTLHTHTDDDDDEEDDEANRKRAHTHSLIDTFNQYLSRSMCRRSGSVFKASRPAVCITSPQQCQTLFFFFFFPLSISLL